MRDGVGGESRREIGGVLAEADGAAGDRERAGDEDLEEEEEAEELAEAALVDGAEIGVGASCLGEGGAELGPDEAVGEGEERAEDPAEHGLWATHGSDEERQGDEGADADHVEQVEGNGAAKREGAGQLGFGGGADEVEFSGWLGESRK